MTKIEFQHCLPPCNPPMHEVVTKWTEDGLMYYVQYHRRIFIDDQCFLEGLQLEFMYEHYV